MKKCEDITETINLFFILNKDGKNGAFHEKHTHMTTVHDKEKPFECKHCVYSFSTNGILKRHMIVTHTLKHNPYIYQYIFFFFTNF